MNALRCIMKIGQSTKQLSRLLRVESQILRLIKTLGTQNFPPTSDMSFQLQSVMVKFIEYGDEQATKIDDIICSSEPSGK